MTKLQIRALAIAMWLGALACTIAYLGLREEYVMLRDGTRVQATVTQVEPSESRPQRTVLTLHYRDDQGEHDWQMRGRAGDRRHQVGATIELVVNPGHQPITAERVDGQRPSPLLPAGAVAGLALGVLVWRIPRRAARRRAARRDPLEAVIDAVARTRNHSLGGGLFLVVAAAGFAAIPLVDGEAGTGAIVFIAVLAGLSLLLGVILLGRAYRLRDPHHNPLTALIVDRPADIAWYYVHERRSKGGINYSIHVWTSDGACVQLTLVEEDVDAVLAEIARRAPHAPCGYDRESRRLYRERPDRWRPRS